MNQSWVRHLMLLPTRHLLRKLRHQLIGLHSGLVDIKLLTFDEIAGAILLECDVPYQRLTPFARRKLIQRLMEEHRDSDELRLFRGTSFEGGFVSAVIHQIGELKRAGMTPAEWKQRVDRYPNERSLAIAFLYEKYQERLYADEQCWLLDTEEMLIAAQRLLLSHSGLFPRLQQLTIDHFTDFTPLQLKLLYPLIDKAAYVEIRFPFHPERLQALPHLQRIQQHVIEGLEGRGLKASISQTNYGQSIVLHKSTEGWQEVSVASALHGPSASDELRALQRSWMLPIDGKLSIQQSLQLLPAASPKREVDIVALEVKRLIVEENVAPEDIAIILRQDSVYGSHIERTFHDVGVGIHRDETIPLLEIPWVKELLALCRLPLIDKNWHRHLLVTLADSGYLVWEHPPAEGFLRWSMEAGVLAGRREWKYRLELELRRCSEQIQRIEQGLWSGKAPLEEEEHSTPDDIHRELATLREKQVKLDGWLRWLDELERLTQSYTSSSPKPVRHWISVILTLTNKIRINTPGDHAGYAAQWYVRDQSAREQWLASMEQLEQDLALVYDNYSCTWMQFLMDAEILWKELHVVEQKGQSNGVRVLDPSGARGDRFHTVFVLGMNEGRFPIFHREQWLFNDADRWLYSETEDYLLPASHFHNEMEVLFLWLTAALPRERLFLSYVSPEKNEKILLSPFIEWVLENVETGRWQGSEEFASALGHGYFPTSLYEVAHRGQLLRWHLFQGKLQHPWLEESHSLVKQICAGQAVEQIRYEGPFGRWDGKLESQAAQDELARIFSPQRSYSTSLLNEYAKDAFLFFLKRVLRIQVVEEREEGLTPAEKGSLLHEILRRMLMDYRGVSLLTVPLEALQQKLREHFDELCQRWEELMLVDEQPLWLLEKERLWKQCLRWLQFERQQHEYSSLRPAYLEFSFGLPLDPHADPASVTEVMSLTIGSDTINIHGRIDRVDVNANGQFVIYDYKNSLTRNRGFSDVVKGMNFQLPLYLAAFHSWISRQGKTEYTPIGAGFYSLDYKEIGRKAGIWSKELASEVGLTSKNGGVVEDLPSLITEALEHLPQLLSGIRQGNFHTTPKHVIESFFADNAVYRRDMIRLAQRTKRWNGTNPSGIELKEER